MAPIDNELCNYHIQDHLVVSDLKDAIKVIIDGQHVMHTSIVQLTEAFKGMDRLEDRLEKIEYERKREGERRDKEIAELKTFMNKAVGYIGAAGLAAGFLVKFI